MTDIENKKIERMVLKEDDIMVITVPTKVFMKKQWTLSIYKQIKKSLLPKKNKILILPEEINLSVIGKDEIKEHISHVDLWNLFDEEGEEIHEI